MNNGQCESFTGAGHQCTRRYKHTNINGVRLCGQHKNSQTTIHKKTEPWTKKKLPAPSPENGIRVIQKIRRKILRGPKVSDGGGSIYIYSLKGESKLNYFKIGKTERNADDRLKEWAYEHKREILCEKVYKVSKNVGFMEKLIHFYLAYCNMHRTPSKRGFHSVYSLDGTIIKDGQEHEDDEDRMVAKSKHIEWFHMKLEDVKQLVHTICVAYDII